MRDRFLVVLVIVLVAGAAFRTMSRRHAEQRARQREATAITQRGTGDQAGANSPIPLREIHVRPGKSVASAGTTVRHRASALAATQPLVRRPALAQQNDPDLKPRPSAEADADAQAQAEEEAQLELEPLVPKEVARMALGFVGEDPDAEELWYDAINDPNRPAEERKDLIEDLNEDGFEDPKNLTEDDIPLILSRLQLIEELAPDAADDVNEAAFAEAYKDLVNMLAKAQGQN
jgi:hypothetical protein